MENNQNSHLFQKGDNSSLKVLRGEDLTKSYKSKTVVKNVNITLKQGEIVGLLGPNGAGKTTSFYMMVGLVQPNKGNIFLDQEIITELTLDQRALLGVAYLTQEASIFRELTVEENILTAIERKISQKNLQYEKLEEILALFQIERVRKSKGRELSGGERRRVEIARTMALRPSFILLDEPFAGVDPLAVAELKEIIRQLKRDGLGILITDHNVRETLDIVDRGYIMSQGTILVSGRPEEIINNEVAKKYYLGEEFKI